MKSLVQFKSLYATKDEALDFFHTQTTVIDGNVIDCFGEQINEGLVIAEMNGVFGFIYIPLNFRKSFTAVENGTATNLESIKTIDLFVLIQANMLPPKGMGTVTLEFLNHVCFELDKMLPDGAPVDGQHTSMSVH